MGRNVLAGSILLSHAHLNSVKPASPRHVGAAHSHGCRLYLPWRRCLPAGPGAWLGLISPRLKLSTRCSCSPRAPSSLCLWRDLWGSCPPPRPPFSFHPSRAGPRRAQKPPCQERGPLPPRGHSEFSWAFLTLTWPSPPPAPILSSLSQHPLLPPTHTLMTRLCFAALYFIRKVTGGFQRLWGGDRDSSCSCPIGLANLWCGERR